LLKHVKNETCEKFMIIFTREHNRGLTVSKTSACGISESYFRCGFLKL